MLTSFINLTDTIYLKFLRICKALGAVEASFAVLQHFCI